MRYFNMVLRQSLGYAQGGAYLIRYEVTKRYAQSADWRGDAALIVRALMDGCEEWFDAAGDRAGRGETVDALLTLVLPEPELCVNGVRKIVTAIVAIEDRRLGVKPVVLDKDELARTLTKKAAHAKRVKLV